MAATKTIEGFMAAAVTPFNEAGELMADNFEGVLDWLLAKDCDGICVAGNNGENWALETDDRKTLATLAAKRIGNRVPWVMGVGTTTARQSIGFAEIAAEAGATAMMISPQPYVGKATTAEVVERFAAIHKAVPLPVLVFNSPRYTGISITPDILGAIADAVPVVALKESSRDLHHTSEIIQRFGDRLSVMIGPGYFIFPGLALGAKGFISTGPECMGHDAKRFRELALAAPSAESRRLHHALNALYPTLLTTGTAPAGLKCAMNMLGVPVGVPRDPVKPLTPRDAEQVRATLVALGYLDGERQAAPGGGD